MPSDRFGVLNRIKQVEREHDAARFAMDRLLETAHRDPTQLDLNLKIRDLATAADRLESTYLIRLFAEFEAALRLFWKASRVKDPPVRTRDLVESIGVRQHVPTDLLIHAHSVREFRNSLVHEGEQDVATIQLPVARGYLCHFMSFLPRRW